MGLQTGPLGSAMAARARSFPCANNSPVNRKGYNFKRWRCPARIRTWNLLVQSQALCQLSYRARAGLMLIPDCRFPQWPAGRASTAAAGRPRHAHSCAAMRCRTFSRSAEVSEDLRPSVNTGGSTRNRTYARPMRQPIPGRVSWDPSMTNGKTGTCALIASRNAPSEKAPSRPSRERVPSGKNITEHRCLR